MIHKAELPFGAKYVEGGIFIPLAPVRQSAAENHRVRVVHPGTTESNSYIVPVAQENRLAALKGAIWGVMRVVSAERFIALKEAEVIRRKFEGKE